jgi:histidine decarboxylase
VTAVPLHPAGVELDLDAAADLDNPGLDVARVLDTLLRGVRADRATNIGFPGATDLDYSAVGPFFGQLWNNVGDPWTDPGGAAHTKPIERAVLNWFGALLGLPSDERWGYVTTGGTEGNLAALHAARSQLPQAVAYYSEDAHYSIPKLLDMLGVPSVAICADERGEMDYDHLGVVVAPNRHRPAIVIATAGTTMTEAVDDLSRIDAVLRRHGVRRRHVHVDAALAGVPLALDGSLRLDRADSIAISGHKFFATPIPCGVVLVRRSVQRAGTHVPYTDTLDTTVTGSRCGQAALLLWHAIATHGREGLLIRARAARNLAAYATARLNDVGCPAWRHRHAFTVVLPTPPTAVTDHWNLATVNGWSHIICMPGVTKDQVDAFVAAVATAQAPPPSPVIPFQRRRTPAASAR